jgi:hypothetical protein
VLQALLAALHLEMNLVSRQKNKRNEIGKAIKHTDKTA